MTVSSTSTSVPSPADEQAPAPRTGTPLSAALRAGTRDDHVAAEGSVFVERLLDGSLPLAGYVDLAAQQHVVYRSLEAAGDRLVAAGHDQGLVFAELVRVPAIEADLAHLLGDDWRAHVRVLPATAAYAARLDAIGTDVVRYAAHAYTRYLGDLSGGQVVGRMVDRHHGLSGAGVSFYDFPLVHRLKPFKDVYRDRLDALDLTPHQRADVVAEARVAFSLNRAVFADLAGVHCT